MSYCQRDLECVHFSFSIVLFTRAMQVQTQRHTEGSDLSDTQHKHNERHAGAIAVSFFSFKMAEDSVHSVAIISFFLVFVNWVLKR